MTAPTPTPRRRLADRLLDEGQAVARSFVDADRLDPTRPTLGVLVAEAIALAERRGELRVIDGRDVALAALADLVGAVDGADPDEVPLPIHDAADRARRHLRPAGEGQ